MFRINCPACHIEHELADHQVGEKVQCPCGQRFIVEGESAAQENIPRKRVVSTAMKPAPAPTSVRNRLVIAAVLISLTAVVTAILWPKPDVRGTGQSTYQYIALPEESVPAVPQLKAFPYNMQGGVGSLRKDIAASLLNREKSQPIGALMADDDYRRDLAAHDVLLLSGEKPVDEWLEKFKQGREFLSAIFADRAWMEAYLAVGKVPTDTAVGQGVLADVWMADGKSADFRNYLHLSSAIASMWACGPSAKNLQAREGVEPFGNSPVGRYFYFKTNSLAGRLHPMFGKLKSWELTYVVGQRNDEDSYAWFLEHVNVPLQRYPDVCWMVRYRGCSDMGDHIQGPLYYTPWKDIQCEGENTFLHGGVCGSLSTYATEAAAAHGIPAYTVGQPGHCAYAVRFARGKWVGGFGGPDGSTSMPIWSGNIDYVNLTEKVFDDDRGLNEALAQLSRARLYREQGDRTSAAHALQAAVAISPLHLDLRKLQIAWMLADPGTGAAAYRSYARELLAAYGTNAHPAIDLIALFEDRLVSGMTEDEKLAWFAEVNAAAAKSEYSWAWNIPEQILNRESRMLADAGAKERLMRQSLRAYSSTKYFDSVVDWGIREYLGKGRAEAFGAAFSAALDDCRLGEKEMRSSIGKMLVAVEKAHSIDAFQSIARKAVQLCKPQPDRVDITRKPRGILVSSNGALYASSYAWDDPVNHLNVLNETGGIIHTEKEQTPAIVVQLPAEVPLSGILLVKNSGNQWRLKRMRLSRSNDGEHWQPIAEVADMPPQWLVEPPDGTRAKWIKLEALNTQPEHLHIRNILVYAKVQR